MSYLRGFIDSVALFARRKGGFASAFPFRLCAPRSLEV